MESKDPEMNSLKFEHVYFCRNCENEIKGYPFGRRTSGMQPLCKRCTLLGEKEGVAHRMAYPEESNRAVLLYFVGALIFFGIAVSLKLFDKVWR